MAYSIIACAEEAGDDGLGLDTEDHDGITGEITASVLLSTDYNLRHALINDLLGNRRPWPKISTSGRPVALKAQIVGYRGECAPVGQMMTYPTALIAVSYGVPAYKEIGPFNAVEETISPLTEYIQLDHTRFQWDARDSTGTPLRKDEAPGFPIRKLMLSRTAYKVTQIPTEALDNTGMTNATDYYSPILKRTFKKETLLYLDPSISRTLSSAGNEEYRVEMKWGYHPNTWNKFYRSEVEKWSQIYSMSRVAPPTPIKPFPPVDMSALL